MARFIQEPKHKDGQEYPAASLTNVVSAIQRHLRSPRRVIFWWKGYYFWHSKEKPWRKDEGSHQERYLKKRQAQPLTPKMEDALLEKSIFSQNTGKGLFNVIFWYSCKMFGLRAGDEHRSLEIEQLKLGSSCVSQEEAAKIPRWIKSSHQKISGYTREESSGRDVQWPALKNIWKQSLQMVSSIENLLGITLPNLRNNQWVYTPYKRLSRLSVRKRDLMVTLKTTRERFKHNVDEQLIMRQTGHRSESAVRQYKRPSHEHEQQVSDIPLQPPPPKQMALNLQSTNIVHLSTSFNHSVSPKIPFTIKSHENSIHITINN